MERVAAGGTRPPMNATPTSTAEQVRARVLRSRRSRFWHAHDFAGPVGAVSAELVRLAAVGELARIRPGLYWRGQRTRFGMVRPSQLAVALRVAGRGAGPTGVTGAHALGLTSQVPGTILVAVPGTAPAGWDGVRFESRPRRRRVLTSVEVAVVEVLCDPAAVEVDWDDAVRRLAGMVDAGAVRAHTIGRVVDGEGDADTRARWASVLDARDHGMSRATASMG